MRSITKHFPRLVCAVLFRSGIVDLLVPPIRLGWGPSRGHEGLERRKMWSI